MNHELVGISETIAAAIARRDVASLAEWLAPGFVHRGHGGEVADAEAFLRAIAAIPGEIVEVRVAGIVVDPTPSGALVTGIQHAAVRIDGTVHAEARAFIDWFVRMEGAWRLQAAVDLPLPKPEKSS